MGLVSPSLTLTLTLIEMREGKDGMGHASVWCLILCYGHENRLKSTVTSTDKERVKETLTLTLTLTLKPHPPPLNNP